MLGPRVLHLRVVQVTTSDRPAGHSETVPRNEKKKAVRWQEGRGTAGLTVSWGCKWFSPGTESSCFVRPWWQSQPAASRILTEAFYPQTAEGSACLQRAVCALGPVSRLSLKAQYDWLKPYLYRIISLGENKVHSGLSPGQRLPPLRKAVFGFCWSRLLPSLSLAARDPTLNPHLGGSPRKSQLWQEGDT